MFLTDLSIKRPVVASVMSLVLVIFGLVTFQEIPTDELPDVQPPVVTIQTEYRGASAEIVDTQITQKIEEFVGGTPGLETIDSFSEDESSRITLTFETDLDLDDVTNDVRSSVSRVLDNLPEGAAIKLPPSFNVSIFSPFLTNLFSRLSFPLMLLAWTL